MMRFSWTVPLIASAAMAVAAGNSQAQSPATQAALVTPTPDFTAAVGTLTGGGFKTRQVAIQRMQQAYAQVAQAMLTDQNLHSPAAVEEVLRLNAGFSIYLQAALAEPAEARQAALQWGLQPDHLALVSRAYSTQADDRAKSAPKLAAIDDPQARVILAALVGDSDRDVHLAAMDALWDAPPSAEVVAALWERAINHGLEQARPPSQMRAIGRAGVITPAIAPGAPLFHGLALRPAPRTANADSDIATQMLIHYNSPLVAEKIAALLMQAAEDPEITNKVFQPFGFNVKANLDALFWAYRNNAIISQLYALATASATSPNVGGSGFLWNTRVSALGTLVTITGQDAQTYHLHKIQGFTDLVVSDPTNEAFAVDKLKAWWSTHAADYSTGASK